MDPTTPTLEDVIDEAVCTRLRDLHTAIPGRVVSYDATKQTADVQPLVRYEIPDADGAPTYEELPVLPNVPVLWPRSGSWFLAMPLAEGDTVQLLFNERAIGHWRAGDGEVTHPGDLRLHDLSHAVAIPGLYPTRRALTHAPPSAGDLVFGSDANDGTRVALKPDGRVVITQGSTVVLQVDADGTVQLGGNAGTNLIALANLVDARIGAIVGWLNGHTHPVAAGVAGVSTPPLAAQAPTGATKAKAL